MNEEISEEDLTTEKINEYIDGFYNGNLTSRQEMLLLTVARLFPPFGADEEHIFFDLLRALSNIYVDSLDNIAMYAQYTNKFVDSTANAFLSAEEAEKFIEEYDGPKMSADLRMVVAPPAENIASSKFRVLVIEK